VSAWIRIAGRWPPDNVTTPTPPICEIFCASRDSTRFRTSVRGMLSDVTASVRTGASAGFTFAYTGGAGKSVGSSEPLALIAACTSCSATSSVSSRPNCSVTIEAPAALVDDMRINPGICPS
jgi:hypothetical protein